MIGISLYPDKTTKQQDEEYLTKAWTLGFRMVFMSFLQIDINDPLRSINRIKESSCMASDMGFSVALDIHPMVFQYLPCKSDDLAYFHDMKVSTLRLDSGIDGKTEAMMTRNPYGIHIEINMSNDTHMLESILDYRPDKTRLCGSHNFYPQRFTGLSRKRFLHNSRHFQQHHIKGAAFITSQCASITPWPIDAGLCTLEDHRDLPIQVQARHMKMMGMVDTIIIANAYASDEELQAVSAVEKEMIDCLHVTFFEEATAFEMQIVLAEHEYRGDTSDYVIRSSKGRMKYRNESIPAHRTVRDIHKGDILVLNDDYMQYKAEIQIALCDRPGDEKINVVGHIVREELLLLDELQPFQKFCLQEVTA